MFKSSLNLNYGKFAADIVSPHAPAAGGVTKATGMRRDSIGNPIYSVFMQSAVRPSVTSTDSVQHLIQAGSNTPNAQVYLDDVLTANVFQHVGNVEIFYSREHPFYIPFGVLDKCV